MVLDYSCMLTLGQDLCNSEEHLSRRFHGGNTTNFNPKIEAIHEKERAAVSKRCVGRLLKGVRSNSDNSNERVISSPTNWLGNHDEK